MPRHARIVVVDLPHHVTQRGNHQEAVFLSDEDRAIYLDLIRENARQSSLTLLGYALMGNHVHWIVVPRTPDAMAKALGRAHYRYAHYYQARRRVTGHLWQNRFYSCPLEGDRLPTAMRYVELNPVRAGLATAAGNYLWSSARAHLGGADPRALLDLESWCAAYPPALWQSLLSLPPPRQESEALKRCTFSGKPLGSDAFLLDLERICHRDLATHPSGRPKKNKTAAAGA
jgi:putative transposase